MPIDLDMDTLVDIRDAVLDISKNRNEKLIVVGKGVYVTRTNHHGSFKYTVKVVIGGTDDNDD